MGIWNVMEKRDKRWKVISLKIQSTGKYSHRLNFYKVAICGLVVAFVSLSCAIGVLDQNDPLFNAPIGLGHWTPTPLLTFAADVPMAIETSDPPPEVILQLSTDAPTPTSIPTDAAPLLYYTQAGDTLPVLAIRYGVDASEISAPSGTFPATGLLTPNTLLIIPHRLVNTTSSAKIIPDSELIFSPSAIDFDIATYVSKAGGYLSTYREWLGSTQWTSGAEVIHRVALENSINPRLLLALLEYQSNWVYGQPANLVQEDYPLGKVDLPMKGLYSQLAWAVNQLSIGYYGWREGWLTEFRFSDGVSARLAPDLNNGTVAIQYYMAQVYDTPGWLGAIDPNTGIPALYEQMYGNPWDIAMGVEPLYPPSLSQPDLILPFILEQVWAYSGGPHGAWEKDGSRAAVDFAPGSTESGCVPSNAWIVASAPGLIVRAANGVVVEDLDGDGYEQTGWNILYLHVNSMRIEVGDWVETSDLLGHPSCEGGIATGTHVHIARKFNGEWISADGPLPFVLSGWTVHAGSKPYEGTMTNGSATVYSSLWGEHGSQIIRPRVNP
jgi:LasA protease